MAGSFHRPKSRRPLIALVICLLCTAAFGWLWHRGFVPLQESEMFARDWQTRLGRKTPIDDRFVLIGIDKPSYADGFSDADLAEEPMLRDLQGEFPWPRSVWARLIEKLSAAGAKVIALDLVFRTPGDGDEALREQLERHRDRVVIGYNINIGDDERGAYRELLLPHSDVLATESAIEDDRVGFVNIWTDFDGTLRRASFRLTSAQSGDMVPEDVILESLDARILRKAGLTDKLPLDCLQLPFRYTAPSGEAFKQVPVGNVLSPKFWHTNLADGAVFKDKIIIVGPTADIFQDHHNTPFDDETVGGVHHAKSMGGPEVHLQLLNAALHGEFLREPNQPMTFVAIGIAGLMALMLSFTIRGPTGRLFGLVLLVGCEVGFAQLLFDHRGFIMPLAVPLMTLVLASCSVLAYDFVLERFERAKLRHTMGLYFSPRVLEAVLADPGSMEPKRAEVTLLLTDLRNSTPLAEALGPQGMFEMLNQVFEVQTAAIMGEEGNLEHFLGDQFLSYWGAPQPQPSGADQAMRAAQRLIASMESLRPRFSPDVAKLFGYGVALHSGSVLVGNKGSAQRLDYGLVGDAVNEAARIEALTKYYGARLLVSGVTFKKLGAPGRHRLVDRVIVKGKSEPVELYECENPCTPPAYAEICQRYQTAYEMYIAGKFNDAALMFEALSFEHADGPSKVLLLRCTALRNDPPPSWNGIWKMDSK